MENTNIGYKIKRKYNRIFSVFSDREKRRFLFMRTVGNFLVIFSLLGVVLTFAPVLIAEGKYRIKEIRGIEYNIVDGEIIRSYKESDSTPLAKLLKIGKPKIERIPPASTEFGIVIPKIGANARVLSSVDPGNEREYQKALLKGVAHAKGTAFPGKAVFSGSNGPKLSPNRKVYLFAHSTDNWWNVNRYNAVFFLLKELEKGDEIDLFYKGRRHIYKAVDKKIVEADEVGYLVEPSEEELLVLQTCWPPGTTLKRLLVIAKPVSSLARK